jgi:hypothetical protein
MRQLSKTGEPHHPFITLTWLAELDESARKRTEALQVKMALQSESTLKAAWIVAGAAIIRLASLLGYFHCI